MADVKPFQRLRTTTPVPPLDTAGAALRRAATGDEAAFGEFYDLTSALVHGIVLRVVRDPAISEEVTQEVFVELWRVAPRYDERSGSAKGWAATSPTGELSIEFVPNKLFGPASSAIITDGNAPNRVVR